MTNRRVVVFEAEGHGLGDLPDKLAEAIVWLQEKLDEIPADYRNSATFDIGASSYYDSAIPTVEIEYWRPATEQEIEADRERERRRLEQDLQYAEARAAAARKRLGAE